MEVSFTTTHEQSGCAGRGTSHMLFYNIEFYARLIWLLSLSRTHLLIAEENAELLIDIEYEGTGHISGSWLILLDLFYHGGIFTFYCKEYIEYRFSFCDRQASARITAMWLTIKFLCNIFCILLLLVIEFILQ